MFASIFSHLTSKALTVVFQARGVIVYGSDQEVRCWKRLFVCLFGFIGTDGYHVMTSGEAQIIIQRTCMWSDCFQRNSDTFSMGFIM